MANKKEKLINSIMNKKYRDDDPKYYDSNRKYLKTKSVEELEDILWEWEHMYDYGLNEDFN